jgi:hypothetical protein
MPVTERDVGISHGGQMKYFEVMIQFFLKLMARDPFGPRDLCGLCTHNAPPAPAFAFLLKG